MGKIVQKNNLISLKKGLVILVLSFGIVSMGKAQDYKVPVSDDYEFKDAEDYKMYEEDIKNCTAYILSTSVYEDGENWANAMSWMVKWMSGTPDYTVAIRPEVMEYIHKKNSILLFYFMAGWVNDALVNNRDKEIEGNIAGVRAMVNAYQDHPGWKKDKKLNKLIVQMNEDNDAIQKLVRSWFP